MSVGVRPMPAVGCVLSATTRSIGFAGSTAGARQHVDRLAGRLVVERDQRRVGIAAPSSGSSISSRSGNRGADAAGDDGGTTDNGLGVTGCAAAGAATGVATRQLRLDRADRRRDRRGIGGDATRGVQRVDPVAEVACRHVDHREHGRRHRPLLLDQAVVDALDFPGDARPGRVRPTIRPLPFSVWNWRRTVRSASRSPGLRVSIRCCATIVSSTSAASVR